MPPKRIPWIKVETPMVTHPKLAGLPSDAARWGWMVLLCRTKQAQPSGTYASLAHLREESGRFARYIPKWVAAGLLDVAADGRVSIHDWGKHQFDPTHADRQDTYRDGKRDAVSDGIRDGRSARVREGDSRQETTPSNEGDAREIMPVELATRRVLNGGGSERQIEAMLGMVEQLGEPTVLRVLDTWANTPVRDRYGGAFAELRDLAARGKSKRRAVQPTTNYDRLMQSDDDLEAVLL